MIRLKGDSLEVDGTNFVIKIIDLHWIDRKETIISNDEYEKIIFNYADKLKNFYDNSLPKILSEDYHIECYFKFWEEWDQIRSKQ